MSDFPNNNFYKEKEELVRFHKSSLCFGFCVKEYGAPVLVSVTHYLKNCPYCGSIKIIHKQIKPKNYSYSVAKLQSNHSKLTKRYSL